MNNFDGIKKDKSLQETIDAALDGFDDSDSDSDHESLRLGDGLWSKIKADLRKIEPKEPEAARSRPAEGSSFLDVETKNAFEDFKTTYLNDPKNSRQPHAFMRAATEFATSHPQIDKNAFFNMVGVESKKLPGN